MSRGKGLRWVGPRSVLFQRFCWSGERPFLGRVPFADGSENMMQSASATIGESELSCRGFSFPLSGLFLPRDRAGGRRSGSARLSRCPSNNPGCPFSGALIVRRRNVNLPHVKSTYVIYKSCITHKSRVNLIFFYPRVFIHDCQVGFTNPTFLMTKTEAWRG